VLGVLLIVLIIIALICLRRKAFPRPDLVRLAVVLLSFSVQVCFLTAVLVYASEVDLWLTQQTFGYCYNLLIACTFMMFFVIGGLILIDGQLEQDPHIAQQQQQQQQLELQQHQQQQQLAQRKHGSGAAQPAPYNPLVAAVDSVIAANQLAQQHEAHQRLQIYKERQQHKADLQQQQQQQQPQPQPQPLTSSTVTIGVSAKS